VFSISISKVPHSVGVRIRWYNWCTLD